MRSAALLPICLLVPTTSAAAVVQAGGDPSYERGPDGWVLVQEGRRFELDPRVVSVRLAAPDEGLQPLLDELRAAGGPTLGVLRSNRLGIHDLELPAGVDPLDVVARLRATGRVEFAEPNALGAFSGLPNDPLFAQQWSLHNTGAGGGVPGADVDAERAWELTHGEPAVVVALLDSGVELSHFDLTNNLWTNPGEVPGNGVDDDANGFVDDLYGWDFGNGDADVTGPFFHGTATAGVVGAVSNNGLGLAGLAGGWGAARGASLMTVQIADVAPSSDVIDDAILYAVDNGADVLNMSFFVAQTTPIDLALKAAWLQRGAVLTASAGNDGGPVVYPARSEWTLSTPGTDPSDQRWSGSNIGPENWVAAPAELILVLNLGGGTVLQSGTSFSAPSVAAAAALLLAVLPNTSNVAVKEILRLTAEDIGAPGFDPETGWGRLSAGAAVEHASAHDCDGDGIYDPQAIADGLALDLDDDGVPDVCQCAGAPWSYCLSAPNSVGPGATIELNGSTSHAANDVELLASGLPPGEMCVFHYGRRPTRVPFGEGWRCVERHVVRLREVVSDPGGVARVTFDLSAPPVPGGQVQPGDTRRFQCWYRDPAGGPHGYNLTDGLAIEFCP